MQAKLKDEPSPKQGTQSEQPSKASPSSEPPSPAVSKKSSSGSVSDTSLNSEVLIFGKSLEKQPVEGSIELSSDQDSTGGEEDDHAGECYLKNT